MNVPTPLNDNARDDRFDRGLEQLLQANPTGLDEIEPELREITVQMVRLANDAGWIGTDPGESEIRSTPRWRDLRLITNAIAAVALIGVVSALAWFGFQYLNDNESQYGSPGSTISLRPGACTRAPRTDAEIAAIVRKSEGEVAPFQSAGTSGDFYAETLQLSRDWNVCLQQQDWARATAYESEYFIWTLGQAFYPGYTGEVPDSQIAIDIRLFHIGLPPLDTPGDTQLTVYSIQNIRASSDSRNDSIVYLGVNTWVVTIVEGEWYQWPLVVATEWDGTQWVIVSTSHPAMPDSPFKPSDNQE